MGEGAIETLRRGYRWPVGLAAVGGLAAGIFALDLVTPRGVVGGTLYAVLVLASAWLPWPKAPLGTAVIATVLNVAGYPASAEGVVPAWYALTNRTAAFAMIWITALLLYRRLELERALAASQARYQSLLTERALEESRDRYRQLIEASPDAILVHQDGVIRFVNPGALALLGTHDGTVLIGRSVREFLPEANRAAAGAQTGRLAEAERSTPWTEQRLVRLDGHAVAVAVGEVRITIEGQTAAQTIVRDISERQRAERELAQAYGLLNEHLANTPLGVVEWEGKRDQLGRLCVRRWSGQAEQIFGYSEAEMIGKCWDELAVIGATDLEKANASTNDLVRGVKPRNVVTLRNLTRDGGPLVCRWYNSVLLSENDGDLTVLRWSRTSPSWSRRRSASAGLPIMIRSRGCRTGSCCRTVLTRPSRAPVAPAKALRSCSSTSTTSRRSTTPSGTSLGTS